MSITRSILLRAFGRPQGILGRLGGFIMARMNVDAGKWACGLLEVQPTDSVLEVGFGPGVIIQHLSTLVPAGHVTGIDPSLEMVAQARARNVSAIETGRVDLRHGCIESLPFDDESFDKALAINSMQVWPDALAGLRKMRRVMKPGGRIALCFTPYSGYSAEGLPQICNAAGFNEMRVVESGKGFCALATKS
jgi:ubiquinone/menaquinone biosynthesis C-methylase UbiE